jgi:hypothetical protein
MIAIYSVLSDDSHIAHLSRRFRSRSSRLRLHQHPKNASALVYKTDRVIFF